MINFTDLFSTYQNNVTEGMIRLLADDLNVSTDAIKALGVGFWPHKQAWIFPERDTKGGIIGLTTRYIGGGKAMVEGSLHGLTYILNPEFKGGKQRAGSLLQDFIRVHEAKVKCPICGNPDWCLVSRDDPEDPADRPAYVLGPVSHVKVEKDGPGKDFGDLLPESIDHRWALKSSWFRAGARALTDKERYQNGRAEAWWGLRTRFQNGDIAIPDDPMLIAELASITYQHTTSGKVKIVSKDELRSELGRSPDRGDAAMISFAYTTTTTGKTRKLPI